MTDRRIILYAEDLEDIRRIFTKYLQREFPEYDIEILNDGSALEKRLTENIGNVATVITDNNMPGKSGTKIIKEYSKREEFLGIPFILLHAGDDYIGKTALEDGAFAYIEKSSAPENLRMTIHYSLDPGLVARITTRNL